jgi:selenocysteine lyase/cysteine desulfurase
MGCENIRKREEELLLKLFTAFQAIPGLVILAGKQQDRLGVVSFYLEGVHFNLVVRLLNDRFGIQVRGGCSCAGTYGHYLLHVDYYTSNSITRKIDMGDLSEKPGWVRLSIHPTTTNAELDYIIRAVQQVAEHAPEWARDYEYDLHSNEFQFKNSTLKTMDDYLSWFEL